jgi:cysteinyl-tRNA synthetase
MATKYLGERFDIHTGGIDHVRVHHTNEVAQSECALGVHPWVGTWLHNEFLDLGGEKVSKSKGHVLTVDSLVERGIDPMAYRYFFLQAHYRQKQAFSFEAVEAAGTALRRLVGHAVAARGARGGDPQPGRVEAHRRRFWAALADDLNAPRALAAVWDAVRSPELNAADRWAFLVDADRGPGPGADHRGGPRCRRLGFRRPHRCAGGRARRRPLGPRLRYVGPDPSRSGRRGHRAGRRTRRHDLAPLRRQRVGR